MLETRERKVKEQYATKKRAETNYSYSSVHDWTCEKTKRLSNIGAREWQKRHATPMKKEKRWQFKWVVRVRWSLEDNSLHLNYCAWCFVVFLESACRATNTSTSTCERKHTRWRLGRRIAHTHELFVYVIQCKIIQKHAFRWPLVLVIFYAVFIFFSY